MQVLNNRLLGFFGGGLLNLFVRTFLFVGQYDYELQKDKNTQKQFALTAHHLFWVDELLSKAAAQELLTQGFRTCSTIS